MRRLSAGHVLYLCVVLSLIVVQFPLGTSAARTFDSPLPTPTVPPPSMTPAVTLPPGTATPTPPPGPLATPSVTPSATPVVPTPTPLLTPTLRLALAVDPAWAEPGDIVTWTVSAANPSAVPIRQLAIAGELPEGLALAGGRGERSERQPRRLQLGL
jgi:uncharacterized repeat protein (TIGR01451 family)